MTRDPRIDAYIAKAAPFARPILEKIRERIHAVVPKAEETMKWGAPAYTLDGKILLITAAFKAHAAVNFWRGKELGFESADGMGQLGKLGSLDDLPDDDDLDRYIHSAAQISAKAPLATEKKPAKPMPDMHPDLARALDANAKAKASFDAFPPGQQREYLDWISEAKRDDTRAKRVAQAIEWLAEGKRRHWKYENC